VAKTDFYIWTRKAKTLLIKDLFLEENNSRSSFYAGGYFKAQF